MVHGQRPDVLADPPQRRDEPGQTETETEEDGRDGGRPETLQLAAADVGVRRHPPLRVHHLEQAVGQQDAERGGHQDDRVGEGEAGERRPHQRPGSSGAVAQ